MRMRKLYLICVLFLFAVGLYGANGTEVMLQGFNWESHNYDWYNTIASKASDLKASGIDMVWFPPPSLAPTFARQGYLPVEYYNLNSYYGSQAQLQNAINALHGQGVKAIADIVINHRVGKYDWADFVNPSWGSWAVCGDDEWAGATGNNDSGGGYAAARDLDHSNMTVQNDIKAWMGWLKNTIGFDGWRYDYTKGYWGGYNKIYNNATSPFFSVGETWPDITGDYYASGSACDYHRQILSDWVNATGGTSTAFDFTTKWQLQLALERNELWRMGSIPGLIGWWGSNAVTFLDNHDTGSTQAHWPFPGDKVMQGYAYILTHPGIPSVFWDHFYDWGLHDAIKDLIKVRKDNGLTSTSTVDVQAAQANLYAAIIDGKVAMKIGSGNWDPGTGWEIKASGTDYAVWAKSSGGGGGGGDAIRTVIFIRFESIPGEMVRMRGGHDGNLVPANYPNRYEVITSYNNLQNPDTAGLKQNDTRLDWGTQDPANGADGSDSLLDWTCNAWPSSWGTKKTYANDGFGEDAENTWGLHYWKFDANMEGSVGDWFEFKMFIYNYRNTGQDHWESNINQSGTPQTTINHWGRKGYITRCAFDQSWVEMTPL